MSLARYLWTWIGDEWVVESVAHLTQNQLGGRLLQLEAQGYGPLRLGDDDEREPATPEEGERR